MGGGSSSTQTAWSRDPAVSKLPVLKLGNHMAVSVIITGAIDSVLDKLMGLPGDEHRLDVKLGIQYLKDELSIMRAVLLRLSETEEHAMDPQSKEWRDRVQDMSFDIENCIDRFMLRRSHGSSDGGPMDEAVGILKSVRDDLNAGKEIQAMVAEESERRSHAPATAVADMHPLPPPHVPLDPRVHTPYEAARNLVGIDAPRKKIFGWLAEEDTKPNVVAIFGIGGSGKTTLALEVYNKIHEEMAFDCRAFVSVSQTPDINSVFKQLLFQVNKHVFYASEMWDLEQLILKLREELQDKRYLIVIDDTSSPLVWQNVKSVLPIDNNERSRIIATTRIEGLARSCCADMSGHMYEAKLLTDDDSRSLFFRRIFPSSECCPRELSKLADEILEKCGGLPLAIISISSLLASKSRTVEVWLRILNSISSAIEKDGPFDKMQRILFLCYFDLEPLLRVCLLYLSVFPEDYYIDSRFLIWRWMAEGLLPGENGDDMWMLGESYLNQLMNRSMIQARKIGENGTTVKFCGVHDIVLDFITSQAVEHNFVTVLKDDEYPSKKIRWLSLHLHSSEVAVLPIKDASPLRSIHMFGPVGTVSRGKQLPQNCEALRVLNIEGVIKFENCDIQHIGCFYQLKYLRIVGEEEHTPRVRARDYRMNEQVTTITELPKQIGNLHNLEVLDLRGLGLIKLPATVVRLKKLVCLFLNGVFDPLPDGMENLQCLEELSRINLCEASMRSVQGLGDLRRLRRLEITWELFGRNKKYHVKACATSLSKLVANSLHSLHFSEFENSNFLNYWVFPSGSSPPLRRLVLCGADNFGFPAIPRQISSLINLTRLRLSRVCQMGEQGVNILGSLPMLLSLTLSLGYSVRQCHVISCQGFQRLMKLHFCGETCLMFEPGTMPKLQRMKLVLSRSDQYLPGGFVEGLLHLSSLKHISIRVCCLITDRSVEDLMDEIRRTTSIHPNHPILDRI